MIIHLFDTKGEHVHLADVSPGIASLVSWNGRIYERVDRDSPNFVDIGADLNVGARNGQRAHNQEPPKRDQ